jgi:hypothetical protein
VRRKVTDQWKQSPLNPLRWNATLSCGHDVWVNGKQKPTAKTAECGRCESTPTPSQLGGSA